ncbi:MAG TPA: hypothetical protein VGG63_17080 [Steroidobacteraceae bacterium]|jgi:general secretion pathway protein D
MSSSRHVALGLGIALFLSAFAAYPQASPSSSAGPPGTVPLDTLIADVAKNTGLKFVLDPRVRAPVTLIGERPSSVTYDELLTILGVYGFVAVKSGGYVLVLPDAFTRMEQTPVVTGSEKLPDNQAVTAVIHVRSTPAAVLVPILRPLVPQWGHLAAEVCTNDLVIVERFANVRRMEAIVKAMDTGAPITPPKCPYPMPQ